MRNPAVLSSSLAETDIFKRPFFQSQFVKGTDPFMLCLLIDAGLMVIGIFIQPSSNGIQARDVVEKMSRLSCDTSVHLPVNVSLSSLLSVTGNFLFSLSVNAVT